MLRTVGKVLSATGAMIFVLYLMYANWQAQQQGNKQKESSKVENNAGMKQATTSDKDVQEKPNSNSRASNLRKYMPHTPHQQPLEMLMSQHFLAS